MLQFKKRREEQG
jgi:hypothetical protein